MKTTLPASPRPLKVQKILLLALVCWLLPAVIAQPQKTKTTDQEFKAAFLSKIPPYVQWPPTAFSESENQLIVGILGDDPVVELLKQLLHGKQLEGRALMVQVFERPDSLTNKCHILFVPLSQKDKWQEWSRAKALPGLLSVGESEDFISKLGGVFNLSVADRTLEISLKNAKKAGLEVNSKLLKIAKVIK